MAETITFAYTESGEDITVTLNEQARGPAGANGASTWGSITGTLSSQTDLNSALAAKAPLVSPSFTTPGLGVATATSINGNTITAGTGTLTLGAATINSSNGAGADSIGGLINTSGGSGAESAGGTINTSGGSGTESAGGILRSYGGSADYTNGGSFIANGGTSANASGGSANLAGGALPGGNIDTSNGGGSITTTAGGSLTMGSGTLTGPNFAGTIATLAGTETLTNKTLTTPIIQHQYAALAADQTTSSNTTLTDLTGVSLTLAAGTYRLTGLCIVTPANSTMGIKIGFNYSGTGTMFGMNYFTNNNALAGAANYVQTSLASGTDTRQVAGGTNSQPAQSKHDLIVVVTATTTLKYQFAQHTSNGSNLTAEAGSYLMAERIA